MKRFLLLSLIILVSYISSRSQALGDFQTFQTGNWNATSTWSRYDGATFVNPAPFVPTNADGVITILNGHNVTVTASTNGDQMTINSGGTLTINGSVTFTAWTGAGDDITVAAGGTISILSTGTLSIRNAPVPPPPKVALIRVHGTLNNAGSISNAAASRLFFEAGSTYDHQHTTTAGVIPSATWNITSMCQVTGYTTNSGAPTGLGQTFGNFVWDIGSSSSFIDLNGGLTTVDGDLTIQNNPSSYTYLTSTGDYTLNVGGNFTIDNSYFGLNSTATATINVTGNVLFKDNTDLNPSFDGNTTLDFGGNFEVDAGTINFTYGGAANIPINVGGNVTLSNSPTINNVGTGTYTLTFDGSLTQTYTATQAFPLFDYVLENGSDVNVPNSNYFSGAGDFTLEAGATFGVQDVNGLVTGTTSGNVRVSGTRTYTASANIVYNGSSAQDLGDEWDTGGDLNGVAVNLEIDNASGVTNNIIGTTSVVGVLTLTDGPLNIGNANTFDIKGNFVEAGGVIAGHVSGTSNLIFSGTGTFTGTLDIASPFDLNDLTINRSGTVTLGTELDINGSLSFASTGNLDISGQTLTIEGNDGDITQTGSGGLVSTLTTTDLLLNGTEGLTALPFCTICGTMNLNDVTFGRTGTSPAYTWNSAVTINGDVFLNSGVLTHTSGFNMATGSTFNRGASGSISAAPTATTTYNVAYNGTLTTGPELPTVASGDLNNLTVAGDATLDKAIDVNGILTVNSGTFAASTNNVTLSGSTFIINAGTFTINAANTFTFDNAGTTTMSGAAIGGTQFGNLTIASGTTLSAPNANINVSGTWTNNQTFTPNSGTVTFNGGNQNIDPAGQPFNNVDFAGTLTKTLQGALDVDGTLTINSTLDVGANNAINVAGSWVNSGTFTPGAGTVTFDGTSQTITSAAQAFFNLTLATGGTKTLGDDLDINGALTINSTVTLDVGVGANAVNLAGNWVNNGTDFDARTGTVTFDGTTTVSGSTTTDFHHVTIAGGLTAPAGNLDVTGDWLYSSGTFTNAAGTVRFTAGTDQDITTGAQSFNNVIMDGLNTKTFLDNVDINGNLTLNDSDFTLDGVSTTINLAGNWTALGEGDFTHAGEVQFDGGLQTITPASSTIFNDVRFAGSDDKTLGGILDVNGDLDIDEDLNAAGFLIEIGGAWNATDATASTYFTSGSNTVTFDGTTTQNLTSNGATFNTVTVGGTGTVEIQDPLDVDGTLTISSTLDVGTNQPITVATNWNATGTFTQGSGLVTLDGSGAQSITSGGNSFNDLTLAGSGTKSLIDALDLDDDLIISSELASASNNINLGGDWTNNGTYTRGTEKVTFDGAGVEQTITGSSTTGFNDIDVSNTTGAEVNASATAELFGTFDLVGAALFDPDGGTAGSDGGGNFIIKSTSLGTEGRIADLSDGGATPTNFDGEITVERFTGDATANRRIWRYLTPVTTATVADWQDNFTITGSFTGNDNATVGGAGNASLYDYVEANGTTADISLGWREYPPTINTEAITAGVGYSAYIRGDRGDTDDVFDVRGTAQVGDFSFTVTFTEEGWNLLGNPYASPLDWNALFDDVVTMNMNGSMHIKDNTGGGGFQGYNAASDLAINGGSQHISMGQAFWVQASGSGPVLTAEENHKSTSASFLLLETPIDYLRITLTDAVERDETVVHFNEDATVGFDVFDGDKQFNDYFNVSTNYESLTHQAFNTVPELTCQESFGINIDDVDPGNYSLEFSEFESFVNPVTITLIDNFTNNLVDVKSSSVYSFEVTSDPLTFGTGRFEILFDAADIDTDLSVSSSVSESCIGNSILISVSDSQNGVNYQAYIDGNPVSDTVAGDGSTISLDALTDGLSEDDYMIEVLAMKPGCSSVPLQQEAPVSLSEIPDTVMVTDGSGCTGQSVTLSASGAPVDGYYNWYLTSESTEPIEEANEATFITPVLEVSRSYFVTAVNSEGCESVVRAEVIATVGTIDPVNDVSSEIACPGQSVTLTATGAPEDGSYRWYDSSESLIEGETGSLYTTSGLLESTDYFVSVVNSASCESEKISITAIISNEDLIVGAEDALICGGGTVTLTASGAPEGSFYQWYDDSGIPLEGETGAEFSTDVSETTIYSVQIVSSTGCNSELLDVLAEVKEAPEKPEIIREDDILRSSITGPEYSYQWYRDSNEIPGEDGSGLSFDNTEGEYQVEITIDGCPNISDVFIPVVTSINDEFNSGELDLYPNPASDFIRLEFEGVESAKVSIYVIEMSGRIIQSEVLNNNAGRIDWQLDTKEYENGVYFVKLADGNKILTGRFVKK